MSEGVRRLPTRDALDEIVNWHSCSLHSLSRRHLQASLLSVLTLGSQPSACSIYCQCYSPTSAAFLPSGCMPYALHMLLEGRNSSLLYPTLLKSLLTQASNIVSIQTLSIAWITQRTAAKRALPHGFHLSHTSLAVSALSTPTEVGFGPGTNNMFVANQYNSEKCTLCWKFCHWFQVTFQYIVSTHTSPLQLIQSTGMTTYSVKQVCFQPNSLHADLQTYSTCVTAWHHQILDEYVMSSTHFQALYFIVANLLRDHTYSIVRAATVPARCCIRR